MADESAYNQFQDDIQQPATENDDPSELYGLDPDSYTVRRLRHATPHHLHMTARRLFIGPIPDGWVQSHRNQWYKARISYRDYASRTTSFAPKTMHFDDAHGYIDAPDVRQRNEEIPECQTVGNAEDGNLIGACAPAASDRTIRARQQQRESLSEPDDTGTVVDRQGTVEGDGPAISSSFITARETLEGSSQSEICPAEYSITKPNFGLRITESCKGASIEQARNRPESSTLLSPVLSAVDASSTTSLLGHQNQANGKNPDHGSTQRTADERLLEIQPEQDSARDVNGDDEMGRSSENLPEGMLAPLPTKMVRFHVDGDVLDKRQRTRSHIHRTHSSLHARRLRWQKGQDGELIRAQKMLVRVEETGSGLPDDLSENESLKVETLRVDKWREYLVVCRRSIKYNAHYMLQLYKTRVIQDVENSRVRTSSCYEIHLNPKETKVNLFSALDKTVVVWHPCGHGSRMFIFRPRSAAHAVEWYTFIRQAIGWYRPSRLLINVPDLGLSLIFKRPFEQDSQIPQQSSVGGKGHVREQFAADSIVKNCMKMLGDKKEWTYVLREWSKSSKMGLAWKRYDRLEWIHGSNEQQMYGTIAMQTSHDLELRPKHHYPTRVKLAEETEGTEPTPIEGFLGLLTAQNGAEKRMGRMLFARHYFSTSDHFLFFCTPAKAAPPQPPRSFSNELQVPSTREILGMMPSKYEIDPFSLENGRISWLNNGNRAFIKRHDEEAYAQLQRTLHNICNSDGLIDLRHVSEIKPVIEGEHLNEVQNEIGRESTRTYNSKNKVDSRYQFLLLLDSGLHVRLQATNGSARNEWMARLQALVEYWRARLTADVEELRAVRQHNLEILGIDEEMESILGQFAKKWEVKKAQASPHLYNMCAISGCRPVKMSGALYHKPKRRATFSRCHVILTAGKLLIFQDALRTTTGVEIPHVYKQLKKTMDLRDCYIYSGLLTESDMLYGSRTLDSNHPGHYSLPRVYLSQDGWTTQDEDTSISFVIWHPVRKSLFRAPKTDEDGARTDSFLRRVSTLGVPGRSIVFRARNRIERDRWVLSIESEIDRLQDEYGEDLRIISR